MQYILDTVIQQLTVDKSRTFIYVEMAFFTRWWKQQNDQTKNIVSGFVLPVYNMMYMTLVFLIYCHVKMLLSPHKLLKCSGSKIAIYCVRDLSHLEKCVTKVCLVGMFVVCEEFILSFVCCGKPCYVN